MKTTNAQTFALASLICAISASPLTPRVTCNDVHFFTARGTGQPIPDNQDNELVPGVCNGLPSCGYEDVQYPATPGCDSETQGSAAALSQFNAYVAACPGTKVVLAGYSQGAEVIFDLLSGSGGSACQAGYGPLDPNSAGGQMISAVVVFGNPGRTPGQSYNVGTAGDVKGNDTRDQDQLNALNAYAARMQDYCNANDAICAGGSGGTDGNVHASEVEDNLSAAVAWIQGHI